MFGYGTSYTNHYAQEIAGKNLEVDVQNQRVCHIKANTGVAAIHKYHEMKQVVAA